MVHCNPADCAPAEAIVTGTVTLAPGETVPDPTDTVAGCANIVPEAASTKDSAVINNLINDLVGNISLFITPLGWHIDHRRGSK